MDNLHGLMHINYLIIIIWLLFRTFCHKNTKLCLCVMLCMHVSLCETLWDNCLKCPFHHHIHQIYSGDFFMPDEYTGFSWLRGSFVAMVTADRVFFSVVAVFQAQHIPVCGSSTGKGHWTTPTCLSEKGDRKIWTHVHPSPPKGLRE